MIQVNNINMSDLRNNPEFDLLEKMRNNAFMNDILDSDELNDLPHDSIEFNCNYAEDETFLSDINPADNLSFFSLNIQSLPAKFTELKDLLVLLDYDFDVICLQEIWRLNDADLYNIPGYNFVFKCRTNNMQGGGIGIFVKEQYNFNIMPQFSIFIDKVIETLFIEIEISNGKKIIVSSVYRPNSNHPNLTSTQQLEQFTEMFNNVLNEISELNNKVFVMGDMNIDLLKCNSHSRTSEFIENCFASGFLQLITKPTRCFNNSATLIDHFYLNSTESSVKCFIYTSLISDHFPVCTFIPYKKNRIKPKYITVRNFTEENVQQFRTVLSNLRWQGVLNNENVQNSYDNFSETFNGLFNDFFPEKKIKFNKSKHKLEPFMTNGLLISRKTKRKLEKDSLTLATAESKYKLKKFKNMYNSVLRLAKKKYYEEVLEFNKNNLRKTWEILREAMGKKHSNNLNISEMEKNGARITDNNEIADYLNHHFTTIAGKIADQINPTDRPPDSNINDVEHEFNFEFFTTEILVDIVMKMKNKNSRDSDNMSNNFIKKIILEIAEPLTYIFNLSLRTGEIPSQLKVAKVVPIFKLKKSLNDEHLCPLFYRPISLLPIFSKILEKQVANRLINYLNDFDLLYNHQYGYQHKKSTCHPLIHLMNRVSSSLNKGEVTVGVFCDLAKAFDTCCPKILLKKLRKMGVAGIELKWFESYLENRKQFIFVNSVSSEEKNIDNGVPQGSILGPILFLCYINDMPSASKILDIFLFCDDTTLLISGKSLAEIIPILNCELQKICEWFRCNKLSLHPGKTKFMIFTLNENNIDFTDLNICLNYNDIGKNDQNLIKRLSYINSESEIPAMKFLGVYIDPKMSFTYHIEQLRKKLASSVYIMKKCSNFLSEAALTSLYYSLVHSHLVYCNLVWSCGSSIQSLVNLQKRAIRTVTGSKYNAHTGPLFQHKQILPLADLIKMSKIQFMYDYRQNRTPASFNQVWKTNADRLLQIHDLRISTNEFYVEISRLKRFELFPIYNFSRIWNDIDDNFRNIENRKQFTAILKADMLTSLPTECTRLFCHVCQYNASN